MAWCSWGVKWEAEVSGNEFEEKHGVKHRQPFTLSGKVFSLVLTGQSTSEVQILPENNQCKKEQ